MRRRETTMKSGRGCRTEKGTEMDREDAEKEEGQRQLL